MHETPALLRHFLAALAYRTQKALRGAPQGFASFRSAPKVRTPHELLCHMNSVLGYATTFFLGGSYREPPLPEFGAEIARFHATLSELALLVAQTEEWTTITPRQLLQGPLSDAMTHAGQLAMLRRLAGSPVPPEDFIFAQIDAANLGPDQPPPASPDALWPERPEPNGAAATQAAVLPRRQRTLAEIVHSPLVYHVPGEEAVEVRRDVSYRSDPEAKADLYLPAASDRGRPAPIVVFLHGGVPPQIPLRPKEWGLYRGWGRLIAASGFVAVAFNHRLGYPEPCLNEADDDVESLLDYVRSHATEFGGDPNRIGLASFSGGGPLLARYLREPRAYLRCLLAFYSILETRDVEPYRRFLDPENLARFSPALQIEERAAAAPPLFVMRAGLDATPDLNAGMEIFVAAAIRRNAALTLAIHPTGEHGFENTNDDERSREILRAAIEFLREHLGVGPLSS